MALDRQIQGWVQEAVEAAVGHATQNWDRSFTSITDDATDMRMRVEAVTSDQTVIENARESFYAQMDIRKPGWRDQL